MERLKDLIEKGTKSDEKKDRSEPAAFRLFEERDPRLDLGLFKILESEKAKKEGEY